MSEDLVLTLVRVAVIVFPAAFACFILGWIYGKGQGFKAGYDLGSKMSEVLQVPEQRVTRLSSRNQTVEFN